MEMNLTGIALSCILIVAASLPRPDTPRSPHAPRTYATTFPRTENPISEGARWTNGKTHGLDWADVRTKTGLAFGTESGSSGYDDSTALLTGHWGPDQTVEAKVHSVNPQASDKVWEEVEIRLRSSLSPHSCTGYEVLFELPPHNFCQVVRWNGKLGDWTSLGYLGKGIHDGDTVKATITGTVIEVFVNGVSQGQVKDATYATGSPGMGFYLQGTSGVNGDYGFTSLTASAQEPAAKTEN